MVNIQINYLHMKENLLIIYLMEMVNNIQKIIVLKEFIKMEWRDLDSLNGGMLLVKKINIVIMENLMIMVNLLMKVF